MKNWKEDESVSLQQVVTELKAVDLNCKMMEVQASNRHFNQTTLQKQA